MLNNAEMRDGRIGRPAAGPPPGTRVPLAGTNEIVLLGCAIVAMMMAGLMLPSDGFAGVVIGFSFGLLWLLGRSTYLQIATLPAMVWSPLVWFRIGFAVFIAFGTAAPYLADQEARWYLASIYVFTDQEALKFLTLSSICALVVLSIARAFHIRVPYLSQALRRFNARNMLLMALAFLLMGGVARYGVIFPKYFGYVDGPVAGYINILSKAYAAGLFLLLLWTLQNARSLLFVPIVLVLIDAMAGVLSWDKSELVLTLAFAYLAIIFDRFSATRALIGVAIVSAVIYLSQPLVHFGRGQIGLGEQGSIVQRIAVLAEYLSGQGDDVPGTTGKTSPLVRLSYTGPALFFMNRYDEGLAGNAHQHAFAAMVPRILWPEKPRVGAAGGEAYYILRGRKGTSLGITHFGEAYWSFGWWGILVFVPGGLILSLLSLRCVGLILQERWFQLPIVLAGVSIGYRVPGSWVPDVIGTTMQLVILGTAFTIAEKLLLRPQRDKAQQHSPELVSSHGRFIDLERRP